MGAPQRVPASGHGSSLPQRGADRQGYSEIGRQSKRALYYDQSMEHGPGAKTRKAFEESLQKLQTDYVDLYLIHWPAKHYLESWQIMESLYKEGKIRAIGVSNFEPEHLDKVMKQGTIVPAVNQIQTNLLLQQGPLHDYMRGHGIQHVAWSPFGHGSQEMLAHPVLTEMAAKYDKTAAQVILRWNLERGIAVIPKSVTPARLKQNLELFDFSLSDEEMKRIAALDQNKRGFTDPQNKLYLWSTRFIPLS